MMKNNKRIRDEDPFPIKNEQTYQTKHNPQKKGKILQDFDYNDPQKLDQYAEEDLGHK